MLGCAVVTDLALQKIAHEETSATTDLDLRRMVCRSNGDVSKRSLEWFQCFLEQTLAILDSEIGFFRSHAAKVSRTLTDCGTRMCAPSEKGVASRT